MESGAGNLEKPGRRWRYAAACLIAALALGFMPAAPARAGVTLAPFKDKLFGYPKVLASNADGSFIAVDYEKARDLEKRDQVPEVRVWRNYVDLSPREDERRLTVKAGGHSIAVDETGNPAGARFAVIFIHGRGGDRKLGSNDWNFGGNFNRMKNLAVRNGGVYIAPSVPSFDADGAEDIAALIAHVAVLSPNAQIVLSCASMGSFICWRLTHDEATVKRLAGMMIMGGATDTGFL
ncbi:MAG TPA: hypothetical protein VFJ18_09950, partial [Pararhizobium sp.]|nr:hypothetical protein [Pararhizobium sp.]